MDAQFNEKIKNILSDPESMKSILAIASSLGASKSADADEASDMEEASKIADNISETAVNAVSALKMPDVNSDERIKLLLSIKPFLNDKKKTRVDSLIKAIGAARIINTYKDLNIFN